MFVVYLRLFSHTIQYQADVVCGLFKTYLATQFQYQADVVCGLFKTCLATQFQYQADFVDDIFKKYLATKTKAIVVYDSSEKSFNHANRGVAIVVCEKFFQPHNTSTVVVDDIFKKYLATKTKAIIVYDSPEKSFNHTNRGVAIVVCDNDFQSSVNLKN